MDIFSPVRSFADLITYDLLNLGKDSYLGSAANFFIYDVIKIGFLLLIINYSMAVIRYYFPMEKVKNILTKRRWLGLDYLFAALLGVITPFCSCSSIPLFIGFVGAGIPLGVTFAFLISSPLVNEASLYLFPAMFGIKATLIYNIIGIAVAVTGGMIIQKLKLDKYVSRELLKFRSRLQILKEQGGRPLQLKELVRYWWQDGWNITRQVFPYVLLGVGIGAAIHGFVPASLAERYLSSKEWWAVPLAVLIGAPFYANSVGVIPVMEALVGKGVPLGTALAFMTSIVTVSVPELLILRKVMKWQLLATFLSITIIGIVIMGYALNAIL
ncbi:TPA: permease [Candidatus Woesearchaeota archaeon]|nr:Permease [archaeon GW2011_AR15]MBS3103612.1 permease [Candidatus Woesearchaeota archaeon]HIH41788.1 permease [Candidatus Woesearchaeota archaeon]